MREICNTLMPFLPVIITILVLAYICYRVAIHQLDTRLYFHYFDRTNWFVIILASNVIGLMLFFLLEGQQSPRV